MCIFGRKMTAPPPDPTPGPAERQLQQLHESLNLPVEALPLDRLFPVLCPAAFFERGDWPGPFDRLVTPELALTWAFDQPQETMLYLSHEHASYLNAQGVDYRIQAIANLRANSNPAWSHQKKVDGDLQWVALMHDDGFGPSRVLLSGTLGEAFPRGYLVAIPERSCGLVFPAALSGAALDEVRDIITGCFTEGTRPLTPTIFKPFEIQPASGAA
jgi:hypothetical protein